MSTLMLQYTQAYITDKLTRRLAMLTVLLLLVWLITLPSSLSAYAGLGGYMSELLLGDGTDSSLTLSDDGDGPMVLASVPTLTTLAAANPRIDGGTIATLRGNLTSLNGMPRADTWFVWGYDPTTMTNTTAVSTVAATGVVEIDITGFNPEQTVYYQFRAGTDGIAVGSTETFRIDKGLGGWMLENLLTLIIACGIFVAIMMLTGNPIAALISTVIGIIAIAIVKAALGA